jgi:hypothetical protein
MSPARIVILGGCLNSGFGKVPLNALYHRVMARELKSSLDRPIQIRLGRMTTNQPAGMVATADALIQEFRPDVFVFQLRPDFLWGLFSAFWLKMEGRGLSRLRRNPHPSQGLRWEDGLEPTVCPMRRLANINLLAGRMLGVQRHGIAALQFLADALQQRCQQEKAALVFIAPIFGDWYLPALRDYFRNQILPQINGAGTAWMNLLASERLHEKDCWVGDGLHLNADGHREVARIGTDCLLPMLRKLPVNAVS